MKRSALVLPLVLLALLGCAEDSAESRPPNEYVPPEPPTTGNKWVDDGTNQGCFVLVDEECGGLDEADYLDFFESSIFRAGHVEGSTAYVVDGSNLWSLDVADPANPARLGVFTGVGRAMAITGREGRLYVAGADQGLIVLSIDPQDATQLSRVHELKLAGPALDLALSPDGAVAYVAAGRAGLNAVDLLPEPMERPATAVEGFASGVAVDGERIYVAACSNLSVVDASSGELLGAVALESAEGQAPRPVKDVVAQGSYAFVAAGRWGAVVVDVSDPQQPRALGNRTISDDLLYYANGLALSHGHLYIAAGDWGVDRMKLEDFATLEGLSMTPPQAFARHCTPSEDPARQPAPEFQTQLPPPRRQDPLDVVPVGDTLLAMGDASRLGDSGRRCLSARRGRRARARRAIRGAGPRQLHRRRAHRHRARRQALGPLHAGRGWPAALARLPAARGRGSGEGRRARRRRPARRARHARPAHR
ncbi:MAG: LVIVD repeat-containing protein [Myxococcales bacterium]|jgi:hypothetical protein